MLKIEQHNKQRKLFPVQGSVTKVEYTNRKIEIMLNEIFIKRHVLHLEWNINKNISNYAY